MRFRGRSYMAFVLTPELPIADWLIELDEWIRSSAGYFVGRPVVLDLSGVTLSSGGIAHLISELSARDVRVMGLEGTQAEIAPGLPPVLRGGRAVSSIEATENPRTKPPPAPAPRKEPSLAPAQQPGALRAVGLFSRWRRDRARLDRIRSRGDGRRVDLCLWRVARPRIGGCWWKPPSADLLQPHRSGAVVGRWLLPDRRRSRCSLRGRPAQAWLNGDTLMVATLE